MSVSRVTPFTATPVDENSKSTQTNQDDSPRSSPPATTQPSAGANTSVRRHPNAERANLLAKTRRGSGPKVAGAPPGESAGTAWNKGLTLACELVQALAAPRDEEGAAGLPSHEFDEMIRPLAAPGQAPTPANLLADVIARLQAGGLPEQNADLLQKLEDLRTEKEGADVLGFYAAMAVMAAAAKVPDLTSNVSEHVQKFAQRVDTLLEPASPMKPPQAAKLAAMAKAAMKVPFEYMLGKGMSASLSHPMLRWNRTAYGAETKAAQEQLEAALRSFLDARIGKRE